MKSFQNVSMIESIGRSLPDRFFLGNIRNSYSCVIGFKLSILTDTFDLSFRWHIIRQCKTNTAKNSKNPTMRLTIHQRTLKQSWSRRKWMLLS